jgi:hypothetical protein
VKEGFGIIKTGNSVAKWLLLIAIVVGGWAQPSHGGEWCERISSLPAPIMDRENTFHPIIVQAAEHFQVDPALVKAVIMVESRYNPKAVSECGAKGLMQLMPETAKVLGVEDIFNPEQNVNAGVAYLKDLENLFDGNVKLALAAYNAGITKVRKYQGIPPFKVTQHYVKKVLAYYQFYESRRRTRRSSFCLPQNHHEFAQKNPF